MKFVGLAKIWWYGVERNITKLGQTNHTWNEMKAKLKEKYLLPNYLDKKQDKALTFKRASMSIAEYMRRSDEFMIRNQFMGDVNLAAVQFKAGLRDDIRRKLLRQPMHKEGELQENLTYWSQSCLSNLLKSKFQIEDKYEDKISNDKCTLEEMNF